MKKTKIEFNEAAVVCINEAIDRIEALCMKAVLNGNERERILDVRSEVYALRQTIREQAIVVSYKE